MNALITTKRTAFDHLVRKNTYEDIVEQYPDTELQAICEGHEKHYETLNAVEDTITEEGLRYETRPADALTAQTVERYDMVVSVGGDGTMLETAKYVRDETPVLPIRSDGKSRGGLCTYGSDTFHTAINAVIEDDARVEEWTRLEGQHGDTADIALNEVFIGAADSTDAARYIIADDEGEEQQQSSGFIVASGAGSTGWYKNVGGGNDPFQRPANELRYAVREPMDDPDTPYQKDAGIIEENETITVRSQMNGDKEGIIRYDGDKEDRTYDFSRGKTINIGIADDPLYVIV